MKHRFNALRGVEPPKQQGGAMPPLQVNADWKLVGRGPELSLALHSREGAAMVIASPGIYLTPQQTVLVLVNNCAMESLWSWDVTEDTELVMYIYRVPLHMTILSQNIIPTRVDLRDAEEEISCGCEDFDTCLLCE